MKLGPIKRLLPLLLIINFCFSQDSILHPTLLPFKDFIGKTWRGEFPNSTQEKPIIDVQNWELILNGRAIRIMHSVNDGEYGGETIIIYNKRRNIFEFFYFTTAEFYTNGTMEINNNILTSHEYILGNEDGITESKSVASLQKNGDLHVKTMFLRKGIWDSNSETNMMYTLSPTDSVKFK